MKTYEDLIEWLKSLSPEQLDEPVKVIPWGERDWLRDDVLYWLDFAGNRDRLSFECATEQGVYARILDERDSHQNEIIFMNEDQYYEGMGEHDPDYYSTFYITPYVPKGMPYIKLSKIPNNHSFED